MITTNVTLGLSLTILAAAAALNLPPDARAADPIDEARENLRARQFTAAVEQFAAIDNDEARYLQAVALFLEGRHEEAATTAAALRERWPESAWIHKARFLEARALVEQRKHREAEIIFSEEAGRIFSDERKHRLAGTLVEFADTLSRRPDPGELDALPPDHEKALALYRQALDLEIGRDLRDDLEIKAATALAALGRHGEAEAALRAYLEEFDPKWAGAVGSEPRRRGATREHPAAAGRHRLEARLALVRAQLAQGNLAAARQNADDLVALTRAELPDDDAFMAEVRWERVLTFDGEPDPTVRVAARRAFLTDFPGHRRGPEVSRDIALILESTGRTDEAVAAFDAFIEGANFQVPGGADFTTPAPETGISPAEQLARWQREALHRIGRLRFAQRRFDEAIALWQRYVNRFPDGAEWAASQNGIIDAEFQMALDAVASDDVADARRRFDAFLQQHPLDGRTGQILFTLGQMRVTEAEALESADPPDPAGAREGYRQAIAAWARLIGKYPGTEESSLALYRTGVLQAEKLGDPEGALASFRQLTWGSWAQPAQARVALLSEKSLGVATARTFRTNEPAVVRVTTRNIETLKLSRYPLNLEAYFRKTHELGRIDHLDIDLIEPDHVWDVPVEGFAKFRQFEQEVEIPFPDDQPGICVVKVEGGDWSATTLVIRSDIDLILKSSRRELLVYVEDRLRGTPAAGAELLVSDGTRIIGSGTTGEDGVFRGRFEELKTGESVRVFARTPHGSASNLLQIGSLQFSSGLTPRGFLYTDKTGYRPGEQVHVRGVLRDVKDGAYVIPAETAWTVRTTDPSGRLIAQTKVSIGDFGTFDTSLALPEGAELGAYTVTATADKSKRSHAGTFRVDDVKLDRIALAFEFPRRVYFRGETIEGELTATYYWGSPASDRQVEYTLPDGRTFTDTTDGDGRLPIRFDASGFQPGQPLAFQARIPALGVQATTPVFLAELGFAIAVEPDQPIALSGEPFDVVVRTTGADGKPVGQRLTLTVLHREAPKTNPTLEAVPWIRHTPPAATEVTVKEVAVETDPETGKGTVTLDLEKGGNYTLRASGTDRFEQVVTGAAAVAVSDAEDANKLRFFAETATIDVGADLPVRLHSRVDAELALLTFEGEEILDHRVIRLQRGYNPIDLTVDHAHFPSFRVSVALLDGDTLRAATKRFRVRRELRVTVEPEREVFAPGEKGRIRVTARDQLGRPVAAELSLALYNEALLGAFPDETPAIVDFFQEGALRYTEFMLDATAGFAYTARSMRRQPDGGAVSLGFVVADNGIEQLQQILNQELQLNPGNSQLFMSCASNFTSVFNNDRVSGSLFDSRSQVRQNAAAQILSTAGVAFGGGSSQAMGFGGLGVQLPQSQVQAQFQQGVQAFDVAGNAVFAGGMVEELPAYAAIDLDGTVPHQVEFEGFIAYGAAQLGQLNAPVAGTGIAPADGEAPPVASSSPSPSEAIWVSPVRTDADGIAEITVDLPASPSKWHLAARGCTLDTLVGEATAEVVTRDPFFTEVRLPDTLQEGDVMPLLVTVHNLTDYEGDAVVRVTIDGGDEPFVSEKRATVTPESTATVVMDPFTVPFAEAVRVRVEASGGPHSDTSEQVAAVRPWGLEYASHVAGVTATGTGAVLELPEGQRYRNRRLVLSVSPSIEHAIVDLALGRDTRLAAFGRGAAVHAFEPRPQTPASALLAAASGLSYARLRQAPEPDTRQLVDRVRSLAADLIVLQAEDGGWSWLGGGKARPNVDAGSDLETTATAYWALVAASQAGIKVHPDALARAANRLKALYPALAADDAESKAVLLHALSLTGDADFSNANRLYRDRAGLSEPSIAYLAATFVHMERRGFAEDLLALLDAKAQARTSGERDQRFWPGGRGPALARSAEETTAVALWTYARLRRESPVAAAASEFLLTEALRPNSTRSLGAVVTGLGAWFDQGERPGEDFEVAMVVNDRLVQTFASAELDRTRSFVVPAADVRAGRNAVRFDVKGRGRIRFAAMLSGFSPDMEDPKSFDTPWVAARHYFHDRLRYRNVPLDAESTSPVAKLELGQRIRAEVHVVNHRNHGEYLVWEESLPAGTLFVEDSLEGNFDRFERRGSKILLWFRPGYLNNLRYELVAHAPGRFGVLPSVLRDATNRGRMRVGPAGTLEILGPDQAADDPYQMNRPEHFELATRLFDDGRFDEAVEHLDVLYNNPDYRRHHEKDVARMLLWIHTDREQIDAARIVEVFEVLRERHPELVIPFERILTVGRAYREIDEFERAWLVFRAAIVSSFLNDARISAVLEDQGSFLGSVRFQEQLWFDYPDSADVVTAAFALSQSLFRRAPEAAAISARERALRERHAPPATPNDDDDGGEDVDSIDRKRLLGESARLLDRFLVHYPDDPLADDAAFSEVNAAFALKDYERVVTRAEEARARFEESEFRSSFEYMAALGHFWQRHYAEALAAARPVAEGDTRDRDYARYITAQVHHATGRPAKAIEWYEKVRDLYPDAAEAIEYFRQRRISVPEVTTFRPGEPVKLEIAYRNISSAALLVYKVDLMRLYLREKNLANITSIDLAGIDPETATEIPLGDGRDYADRRTIAELPLEDEGAYLVICRGDDLFASGLVLVTPLELEIQEDADAASVRVNVRGSGGGDYVPEVDVKVVGSANDAFVDGETDLRGVFQAEGIHGTATVLARTEDSQYAFYRGTRVLGQPEPVAASGEAPAQQADENAPTKGRKQLEMSDYLMNIDKSNSMVQDRNLKAWDDLRRANKKGVEVQKAQ